MEIEITELEEDLCVGKMPFREEDRNHFGLLHGGVSYTLADIVTGTLAHVQTKELTVTTTAGELHYLRGIQDTDAIFCEARTIKKGRTLLRYEARIVDKDKSREYARGIFTYIVLD